MPNETLPSPAPVADGDLRALCRNLDHRWLRQLAHDLVQAGFTLDRAQWPRWATVAFVNGVRLSHREPVLAVSLASPAPAALLDEAEHLLRRLRPHVGSTFNAGTLRTAFEQVLDTPPPFLGAALADLPPPDTLARWFTAALVWGLRTGLDGLELVAGRCLAFDAGESLGHHFIGHRLLTLARCRRRHQRATLIEMISYSYPARSRQRQVIPRLAAGVLRALRRRGTPLDEAGWVLNGFWHGLRLSTPGLGKALWAELPPLLAQTLERHFKAHIRRDPAEWTPQRLVGAALDWELWYTSPTPGNTISDLERVRHLFDYAFWMGVLAGGHRSRESADPGEESAAPLTGSLLNSLLGSGAS